MLIRFEPFGDLDRWFAPARTRDQRRAVPMDAYRRGDSFFVHFDLPGVDPAMIELTVDKDVLTVKAERTYRKDEGDEIVVNERPQGTFHREVYLSERLDRDNLSASYRDGVLTIQVPVLEEAKPLKVPVSVTSSSRPVATPDAA